MEERITEEMRKVEEIGGMAHAVETGYIQREVARQAYLYEKGLQEGKVHKVGVNVYREDEKEEEVQLHEYNPAAAEAQIKSLKEVRRTRDNTKVAQTLRDLEEAARRKENVMPFLLESVKAYATLGEMTRVFKEVYGEFKEPSIF
jgi:methylmalonyl-CoA mutase N-terminal domain/subunit